MNEFLSATYTQLCQFSIWIYNLMPDMLLGTRGLCHFLIFIVVVGYRTPSNNGHRKLIGALAGIFAGANIAEAYRILYNFDSFSAVVQPPLTIIMVILLFFVLYARGNLAKILPTGPRSLLKK